jgi:uncharacterized FAD-dependent dehydrogenase
MEAGGEKMIYQWNGDLNVITRQTKEFKRVGEILKGLRLGDANPKVHKTQVFSCQAILVALSLLFLAQQYEHDGIFLITILIN